MTCDVGYSIQHPDHLMRCGKDSQDQGLLIMESSLPDTFCAPLPCDSSELFNEHLVSKNCSGMVDHDVVCSYVCDFGYVAAGPVQCMFGSMSDDADCIHALDSMTRTSVIEDVSNLYVLIRACMSRILLHHFFMLPYMFTQIIIIESLIITLTHTTITIRNKNTQLSTRMCTRRFRRLNSKLHARTQVRQSKSCVFVCFRGHRTHVFGTCCVVRIGAISFRNESFGDMQQFCHEIRFANAM